MVFKTRFWIGFAWVVRPGFVHKIVLYVILYYYFYYIIFFINNLYINLKPTIT